MQFSLVLDELARKCGLGGLEPGGELSLLFDGEHTITFLCNADDRSVIMYAEICDVADLTPDKLGGGCWRRPCWARRPGGRLRRGAEPGQDRPLETA